MAPAGSPFRNVQSPLEAVTPGGLAPRHRALIWAAVVAITCVAWSYFAYLQRQMGAVMPHESMMADMNGAMAASWTVVDIAYVFAMWTVMMVAMMTPAAAPVLLLYAGMQAKHHAGHGPLWVLVFGAGYAAAWVGFSAVAALLQWALHNAALLTPKTSVGNPAIAASILCAAGVYQLLPLKAACLRHCRSPLGFLMTHWRDGALGALRMGVRHGVWCVGCCWALMGVLFVVGAMNLAWAALLALFVLLEKTGPAGAITARIGGALLIAAGIYMLVQG